MAQERKSARSVQWGMRAGDANGCPGRCFWARPAVCANVWKDVKDLLKSVVDTGGKKGSAAPRLWHFHPLRIFDHFEGNEIGSPILAVEPLYLMTDEKYKKWLLGNSSEEKVGDILCYVAAYANAKHFIEKLSNPSLKKEKGTTLKTINDMNEIFYSGSDNMLLYKSMDDCFSPCE